jgi:hypothetical protein
LGALKTSFKQRFGGLKRRFKRGFNRFKKFARGGLKRIVKVLKAVAKKFVRVFMKKVKKFFCKILPCKSIGKFFKKLAKLAAKAGQKARETIALFSKCMTPSVELARMKCSDGAIDGSVNPPGMRCLHGGGDGRNWLWTEKLDTTAPPSQWLETVPDSSECQAPGTWPPKACSPGAAPGKEYCSDRISQYHEPYHPYVPSSLHYLLPKIRNSSTVPQDREHLKRLKDFWRKFTVTKLQKLCEKDSKCTLIKLEETTGAFRCVPMFCDRCKEDSRWNIPMSVRQNDPSMGKLYRFYGKSKILGFNTKAQYMKYMIKKTRIENSVLAQFITRWARPTHPLGSSLESRRVAESYGGNTFAHDSAYQTAGDVCLRYKDGSTGLPPTRIRCASQQFYWATDKMNLAVCVGYNPGDVAKLIMSLFKPIKRILPMASTFFNNLALYLGQKGPRLIRNLLVNGSPGGMSIKIAFFKMTIPQFSMPMWAQTFGLLWSTLEYILKDWFAFDLKNTMLEERPKDLLSANGGLTDFAIDMYQDRMQRVYWRPTSEPVPVVGAGSPQEIADGIKGGKKLPDCGSYVKRYLKPAHKDLRCPDTIPVRQVYAAHSRGGDHTLSVFNDKWAARRNIRVGSQKLKVAFIKNALCLKLPICEPKCSAGYQCRWNVQKGNHCLKLPGLYNELNPNQAKPKQTKAKGSERAKQAREDQKTKTQQQQKITHSVLRVSKHVFELKQRVKHAEDAIQHAKDAVQHAKRHAETKGAMQDAKRQAETGDTANLVDAAKQLLRQPVALRKKGRKKTATRKKGTKEAVKRLLNQLPDEPGDLDSAKLDQSQHSRELGEGLAEELSAHDKNQNLGGGRRRRRRRSAASDASRRDKKRNHCPRKGRARFNCENWTRSKMSAQGANVVSAKCTGHRQTKCRTTPACSWENHKCQDKTHWQCAVQSKIIECNTYRVFSPILIAPALDKLCGRIMLAQRPTTYKQCQRGYRSGQSCTEDSDCPCGNPEVAKANPSNKIDRVGFHTVDRAAFGGLVAKKVTRASQDLRSSGHAWKDGAWFCVSRNGCDATHGNTSNNLKEGAEASWARKAANAVKNGAQKAGRAVKNFFTKCNGSRPGTAKCVKKRTRLGCVGGVYAKCDQEVSKFKKFGAMHV